jgi:hypothetical protein
MLSRLTIVLHQVVSGNSFSQNNLSKNSEKKSKKEIVWNPHTYNYFNNILIVPERQLKRRDSTLWNETITPCGIQFSNGRFIT